MKNEILIPVYSEQDLSPKAQDVIREIVNDGFPDHVIKFCDYERHDDKVLVFGNRGPADSRHGVQFVHTYSIAQVMTKPNAATVVKAAIRQFIDEPDKVPFYYPVWSAGTNIDRLGFDYDAPVAIDIETSGNLGVTHTPEEVEILSVAFYQPGKPPVVIVSRRMDGIDTCSWPIEESDLRALAQYLVKFTKAIYHNGKFDLRVMNRVFGVELTNWFDTMLAHHVLNQAAGDHKLKHLARQYLGAPDWEANIKEYLKGQGNYERIPMVQLTEYNGMDVYWTYKLYEFLAPQIEADEEAQKAFMLEMSYADFLLDVEKTGIPFDIEYANELGLKLNNEVNMWTKTLRAMTGNALFNPGSWQQVKAFLELKGCHVSSTDEKNITELMNAVPHGSLVHQFCVSLLNYRKAKKMLGTYVEGWSKHERNGRVHPTFLVHGTSTGRLSSTGPNAQNVPRDKKIRRLVAVNG